MIKEYIIYIDFGIAGRFKVIKDISPYLCSREECLEDINNSIKSCSRKELVSRIPHSELCSLDRNIRNMFFSCYYDEVGNVFLFDEMSPKLVAKHVMCNMHYTLEEEVIYAYVCRVQMKMINEFYKDIQGEKRVFRSSKVVSWNKRVDEEYCKLIENRLNYPIKRLRGI